MNTELHGVIAAAITPVTATFEVDVDRLAHHSNELLSQGCKFVSAFGTTGEGASLSSAQKITALEQLCSKGVEAGKLIPAIMSSSLDQASAMVEAATRLKCRGVLILPPFFYNEPSREGVAQFVVEVMLRAGRPDIDVFLYNIPRFSGVAYDVELIEMIVAELGSSVVGVKDSTGDEQNSKMLVERFPDICIYTGDDRVLPGLVTAGGAGMIGGMPNLFAPELCKIWENPTGSDTKSLRSDAARRIEVIDSSGSLAALKAALSVRYGDAQYARTIPPLTTLDETSTKVLMGRLAEIGRTD